MYGGENVSGCIRRNYPRCGWKNIRYENWLALRAASPQDDRVLQTVKHSAGRNWKEKQILLEYSKDYFDGTASLEDAAKKLMTKITLYLQE